MSWACDGDDDLEWLVSPPDSMSRDPGKLEETYSVSDNRSQATRQCGASILVIPWDGRTKQ